MKLGVSFNLYKNAYTRYKEKRFIKVKEDGFSAVDYNMSDTETELYSLPESDAKNIIVKEREAAESAKIEISQVHGPWRWPPQDATKEQQNERMEKMKKSILFTHMLGCKYWVVHPIMPCGIEDLGTDDVQKTHDLNISFMTELLNYAKPLDVTICLENMPMTEFSLGSPYDIYNFVKEINDDHFKICLDTGHVAVFENFTVQDSILKLGKEIKVLHVHDNMGKQDSHLWPKQGIIEWDKAADALKEIGFDGVFSLETLPSEDLNDKDFEEECIKLMQIAKDIIK